jgi:hypothetical protein
MAKALNCKRCRSVVLLARELQVNKLVLETDTS